MQTIQRLVDHRATRRQGEDDEDTRALDLLKDVFVCVSIPVVVYGLAFFTLRAFLGMFFS